MFESALRIAKTAGDFLLSHFREDMELLAKRGTAKEISTRYDKESDQIIINAIRGEFPDHHLLTEESGHIHGADHCPYTWIVDSLDGSGNFASGNPFFSVSIALALKGEIIIGIIHAPFMGDMYSAQKGGGSRMNDRPIFVSKISDLSQSYIVCCEGGEKNNARLAAFNSKLHPNVKDLRKLGSAALEGVWVAGGRAEAYYSTQLDCWDIAAAGLIVREAGGRVSDFQNNPLALRKSDVLLTNGNNHEALLALLNPPA